MPAAFLKHPESLSVELVSLNGTRELNQVTKDVWIESVTVFPATLLQPVRFPYSGYAGSLEAMAILPLIENVDSLDGAAATQLAIGNFLYQWSNWADLSLPLNLWSPQNKGVTIVEYIAGLGQQSVPKWNSVNEGAVMPGRNEYETPGIPQAMIEAMQAVRDNRSKLILPINEIMPTAVNFQVDALQLIVSGIGQSMAISDELEDVAKEIENFILSIAEEEVNHFIDTKLSPKKQRLARLMLKKALKKSTPKELAVKVLKHELNKTKDIWQPVVSQFDFPSALDAGGVFQGAPPPGTLNMPTTGFPGVVPTKDRWYEDWFLGQQMLQGVAPTLLQLVSKALPANLAVTDEILGNLLGGLTIQQAIENKLLFVVDLNMLDGIQSFKGGSLSVDEAIQEKERYFAAAIGLFFLNKTAEELLPVAIQLGQDPATSPVYTPQDTAPEWAVAKMFFQCGIGQFHQVSVHALRTHLGSEPWEIAVMRNLPSFHPVYKLIKPHMWYTVMISMIARSSLINPAGAFDKFFAIGATAEQWSETPLYSNNSNASWQNVGYVELFQRSYKNWSSDLNVFPNAVNNRGVGKEDLPIDYPYRDDGGLMWDALHTFVCDMLKLSYKNDTAVTSDKYLQAFEKDIIFGLAKQSPSDRPPFAKDAFSTVDNLCETVTAAIWGSGYQHSAVNYLQYDYYGYVPNMPLAMMKPVPARGQGPTSMEEVKEYLPGYVNAGQQIEVTYILSTYYTHQVYSDQVARTFSQFNATWQEKAVLDKFKATLSDNERSITAKNKKRRVYYSVYLPSNCPISITV